MWQRQSQLSMYRSPNPGKHLHVCPKKHVKGCILQPCMKENLETPETLIYRYVTVMEYNAALKKMRNVLAQRGLPDVRQSAWHDTISSRSAVM